MNQQMMLGVLAGPPWVRYRPRKHDNVRDGTRSLAEVPITAVPPRIDAHLHLEVALWAQPKEAWWKHHRTISR